MPGLRAAARKLLRAFSFRRRPKFLTTTSISSHEDLEETITLHELIVSALWADLEDVVEQEDKAANLRYAFLPKVTISAVIETGLATPIRVPKQHAFTDAKPVIPSSLANTPCASLGLDQLLAQLNLILGTPYTFLDTPSLSHILKGCISNNYDFGTAYSRLRTGWYKFLTIIQNDFIRKILEMEDREMREDALVGGQVLNPNIPPRRVWDLYSNRVVPYWWLTTTKELWAISHAWVGTEDRVNVMTPINGNEWPVPIPKNANLDLIRIEMLNLGAEYVWLNVLCLRQKYRLREDLRNDEWMLDIPTIGHVYHDATTVVCYFNGLGQPLRLKKSYWESDRCWFRRAWTLQEVAQNWIIGGETGDDEGNAQTNLPASLKFREQLASLDDITHDLSDVFDMLVHMRDRVSDNPVDKIAGLVFPLRPIKIPAYYAAQSVEGAWNALVNVMSPYFRGDLLFRYPEPGKGDKKWRPSWEQVMHEDIEKLLSKHAGGHVFQSVLINSTMDVDWYVGQCIERGYVSGLAVEAQEGELRRGELIIEDDGKTRHRFEIVASHRFLIPEGSYTLLSSESPWEHWVAGHKSQEGFEKVSVFKMINIPEGERLRRLTVAENISDLCLV